MALEQIPLQTKEREKTTKSSRRQVRREGSIPAILYGKKIKKSIPITVSPRALAKIMLEKGENAIITLEGLKQKKTALLRELQKHPVTDKYIHADFVEVDLTEEIEVQVRFEFIGQPMGVKEQGGIFQIATREAKIKCLASDIPEEIKVDISNLKLHDTIHVADLKLDPKLKLIYDANYTVASVVPPQKEEAPAPAAPLEGEVAAEGAAAQEGKPETKEGKTEVKAAPAKGAPAKEEGGKAPKEAKDKSKEKKE